MDTPKVSVIIPIYNQEKYLRECLETVLLQNLQEIEVICVNDGSTDGSFNILSELAWTDDRLHIINQENKGVGEARNVGIREAKGEFVTFIDPDDKYYNFKALELLYNKAKENNALICGGCFSRLHEGKGEENVFAGNWARYVFSEDRFYSYREYQYEYGFHRFIYDRRFIIDNELFFPPLRRYQDPVWFVKVLHKAEQFFGVTETVYSYRKGHKKNEFDKEKVCHIITGITDVARIAVENKYDQLLELDKIRLVKENAEWFYPYICDRDKEITKLLHTFEKVTGCKNIEIEILANIINKRDSQVASRDEKVEAMEESLEKFRMENGTLKRILDSGQEELKQINENLESVLKELKIEKKTISKKEQGNIIPYPYMHTSHEKDGIKWTDLGDGRIEASGTAEKNTRFFLMDIAKKTYLKTNNLRYLVSTGAPNTSSFTWCISGRIANKGEESMARLLRDSTINDTDGFSGSFEIDTSGYDYFGKIYLFVKKGRTLDHVIFKPEIIPID